MQKLIVVQIFIVFLTLACLSVLGQEKISNSQWIKIDSIHIKKNWRTKQTIILRETELKPGDIVTMGRLDTAVSKIWNIGNFAKVTYNIDTLKDDTNVLQITAKDALTIMPILSFSGNKKEYSITAGIFDTNFLGRNINFDLAGSFGTNAKYVNVNIGIPRQLLYKNMTLRSSFVIGNMENYKYINEIKSSGTAFVQKQLYCMIGNPYHTDYKYTFSPDLEVIWFSQKSDSTLIDEGIPMEGNFHVNYLNLAVRESVGMINYTRHQKNGYKIAARLGYGIGLTNESPGYFSVSLSGVYSKLFNRLVQINADFTTGYTTANLPSLIHYLGPASVKGFLSGERYGQSIGTAGAAVLFTYINRDWFALEQSFFANIGNASDKYIDLYKTKPLYSFGSRLRFMVPMVPWVGFSLFYALRGDGKHWFNADL